MDSNTSIFSPSNTYIIGDIYNLLTENDFNKFINSITKDNEHKNHHQFLNSNNKMVTVLCSIHSIHGIFPYSMNSAAKLPDLSYKQTQSIFADVGMIAAITIEDATAININKPQHNGVIIQLSNPEDSLFLNINDDENYVFTTDSKTYSSTDKKVALYIYIDKDFI